MNNDDRINLIRRITEIEGLTDHERSALLGLLRENKTYGLVWEDKKEDVEDKMQEELPVLKEVPERAIISDSKDAPNHILIEGDNLEALTTLAYTHAGSIDVIYIDPPYNTGKKDEFKYNDKYVDDEDEYRHSKWLSFMNKRLRIAYKLLSAAGLLFISIDDNEIAQLKCVCDEIFNSSSNSKLSNCLGILVWDLGTGTQAGHFTRAHEYVLAYTKNKNILPNFSGGDGEIDHSALKKISKKNPAIDYTFKAGTKFIAEDNTELFNEWGGSEKTTLVSGRMVAQNHKLKYDVTLRAGFAMISQMKSYFNGEHTVDSKGQTVTDFYFNSSGVLHYKKERSIINPPTVIKNIGSTKTGTNELNCILGETESFGYPKPTSLINFLLRLKNNPKYILDFFAGSGTTLHATMQLNAEDGGHRQCILVTNNENGICENVTYERNKRVIQGYTTPKGEQVAGLTNNTLRYYKTHFVPREPNNTNKRELVAAATELLCIKNDVYQEQSVFCGRRLKPTAARYFDDGRTQMLIIYNELTVKAFVKAIGGMEVDGRIKVYVFSNNSYAYADDFESVADKVEVCALPAAIYDAYKKVLPPRKRSGKPADDEPFVRIRQEEEKQAEFNFKEEGGEA